MKREVGRAQDLPAFSLSTGDVQLLWVRLLTLFAEDANVHSTLSIRLPNEQLEFSTAEEFCAYTDFPPRITDFSLSIFVFNEKRIVLRSGSRGTKAKVTASSATEAWGAGAIDTVSSFLRTRKLWYSWFTSAPIGWIIVLLGNAPSLLFLVVPKEVQISRLAIAGWVGVMATFVLLFFGREMLLPTALIKVREHRSFIKEHVAELSLVIAAISAVLTIVGWFITK